MNYIEMQILIIKLRKSKSVVDIQKKSFMITVSFPGGPRQDGNSTVLLDSVIMEMESAGNADHEIFRLAKFYNEAYLPSKMKRIGDDSGKTNKSLSMKDLMDFK